MITVAEARERGVNLPVDDGVAQDIIDEVEAWLARRIGPLDGSRTETFYVGVSETRGKLGLRRYTAAVAITDGGTLLATTVYRLVDNGAAVVREYAAPGRWWTGPYVEAAYTPNDALEVRRVLYELLNLAVDEHAGSPYVSETLGDYSYSKGTATGLSALLGSRAALADSLLPRRDSEATIHSNRPLRGDDPVINRAESIW